MMLAEVVREPQLRAASPGGSTALWCHCNSRCVFVKVPSFSVCAAAGMKNTSVPMSSVRSSPVSISGRVVPERRGLDLVEVAHDEPVERRERARCSLPFAEPTAGFSPITKKPFTLPSIMPIVVWYVSDRR